MAYFLNRQHTRPPSGPVELNLNHPLSRWIGSVSIPSCGGLIYPRKIPTQLYQTYDKYLFGSRVDPWQNEPYKPTSVLFTPELTLVTRILTKANPTNSPTINLGYFNSGTDNFGFGIRTAAGTSDLYPLGRVNNSNNNSTNSKITLTYPFSEHLTVTASWGTFLRMYRQGTQTSAAIDTNTIGTYSGGVNSSKVTRGSFTPTDLYWAYWFYFGKVLDQGEREAMWENPFQVLSPIKSKTYVNFQTIPKTSEVNPGRFGPVIIAPKKTIQKIPSYPMRINWANPITRNLVNYTPLCQTTNDMVTNKSSTVVGTKQIATSNGISRGFGPTYGVGSTDSVLTNLTTHSSYRTYAMWAKKMGGGGGPNAGSGRFFDKGSGVDYLAWSSARSRVSYQRISATSSEWDITDSQNWANNEWAHVVVMIDTSTTGTAPTFYWNGKLSSVTTVLSASGSWITNTNAYAIGNRITDNQRNWDGEFGDFAIWDRLLSAGEVYSLYRNRWQMLTTTPSKIYFPTDALNFPGSPTLGQTYTFNNVTWVWDGNSWEVNAQ